MARKRNDIDDAPVDGDYTRDVVLNKDEAKAYAYVLPGDDMAKYLANGAVRVERTEDGSGARPAYDEGGDGGYTINGQLVLMEMPRERQEAMQARAENKFRQQYVGHRESLQQTRRNSLGSLGPDPSTPNTYRATA